MPKQILYHKMLDLEKAGTGTEVIDDVPVEIGWLLTLENIAVLDEDSALTFIRIGKVVGKDFRPWEGQPNVPANELCFSTRDHKLRADEYFRCQVNGGTVNDKIWVYLEGYRRRWKEL